MENGSSTLPSANESRGFFGTIREHAKPHDAWMLVMEAVRRARAARTRPSAWAALRRRGRERHVQRAAAPLDGIDLGAEISSLPDNQPSEHDDRGGCGGVGQVKPMLSLHRLLSNCAG
jgi:hypothetical protein